MATNPTNSNTVNIRNLPKAQLATSTDSLILQTTNGTQTITFSDFNVVKTDINGNATLVGNLTGSGTVYLSAGARVGSLSASGFWTTGDYTGPGVNMGPNFVDKLIIQNGLILSAVPGTTVGSSYSNTSNPLYTSLYTQLTAASANIVNRTGQRLYDSNFSNPYSLQISQGSTSNTGAIAGLPSNITTVLASDFIITPFNNLQTTSAVLSCVPFIYVTGQPTSGNGYQVSFTLFAGGTLSQNITYGVRLLKTY